MYSENSSDHSVKSVPLNLTERILKIGQHPDRLLASVNRHRLTLWTYDGQRPVFCSTVQI